MLTLLFTTAVIGVIIVTVAADPASNQLTNFKNRTTGPIGILMNSNGAPVDITDTRTLNSHLMINEHFMEIMGNLVRERIPERSVHAKGAGAFGYFEVTHNVTDFCKAKLFSEIGKKTPVVARFSLATKDKGESDTIRDARGFSVKFFTEEGNFNFAGFNTPMYFYKDPIMFSSMVRAVKRNPVTNLQDAKTFWDILTLRPEPFLFFMYIFSDFGIPDGYRYMPGCSIHTYQVYNERGESFFVRFHFIPDGGIRNMPREKAARIAVTDPDYAVKDLFNAIACGNYPTWTLSVQLLTSEDVNKCGFDPFDMTKLLPLEKYPLRPVGKLVLNSNPTNFFSDVEQLAICPASVVPGILGAPDDVFQSRRLSYRDSQLYRLGANFDNILVNCPLRTILSYNRDGKAPVGSNGGDAPNYYPNSYHGPATYVDKKKPNLIQVTHDDSDNFGQAADFYTHTLDREQRIRLIENILSSLEHADTFVQRKAVRIFNQIHPDLGRNIAAGLESRSSFQCFQPTPL